MQEESSWDNAHTPVTLLQLFANAFRLSTNQKFLLLKGIYQDRQRGNHQGYYYDRLKDEQSGQVVTVCVPETIKGKLKHGHTYLLKGALQKNMRADGVIEPVFLVSEHVAEIDVPAHTHSADAIVQQKREQGFKIVNKVLLSKLREGKKPRIMLVHGMTSVVKNEITMAMSSANDHYSIHQRPVNMSNENEICDALREINQGEYDVVAIVKSGNPGQEIFDSLNIAKVALDLRPALLSAVGHAQEPTLLERIADKRFTSPTALGVYLAQLSEVSIRQEVPSTFQAQIEHYERQLLLMRISLILMISVLVFLLMIKW